MSKHLLRGIAALVGAFSLAFIPLVAQAAPTLNWTDISGQLTTRTNRPVWAMTYASPYWFYTDGQDLWNGGQVYRYDGQTQVNITTDVRNAGLSRVDDIVSDGSSVLFLQNVVARNNQFSVLKYQNGAYTNLTTVVRASLASDEGMSTIEGRNGTWFIVTTKNHVFRWYGDSNQPVRIFLPGNVDALLANLTAPTYVTGGVSQLSAKVGLLPTSNGWLMFSATHQTPSYYQTEFYRYDGNTFTLLNSGIISRSVGFSASNGQDVIIETWNGGTCVSASVWRYDGNSFNQLNLSNPGGNCTPYDTNSLSGGLGIWDGTAWLVIDHSSSFQKKLFSVDNVGVTMIGEPRDYFVTGASNGNGTTLLGGAISVLGNTQSTYPLTAKLAKVTEGTATTNNNTTNNGGGQTVSSANGPTLTTSGNPSDFRVGQGGTFVYRATATDTNGVDRIDIFANGVIIKTCFADTCEFSTQYYTNGQSTRSIPLSARAWDRLGNPTQLSTNDNLTVDANSTATANTTSNTTTDTTTNTTANTTNQTSNGIASWTWFDPNQNTIRRDQNLSFNVGAWDADGLSRIEIVVNGSTVKTCELGGATGNQSCVVSLWGGNYPLGTVASMNAKITDAKGNIAWTPLQNINVVDVANANTNTNTNTTVTTNTTNDSPTSNWVWSSPETATIATNQTVIFTVGAWDADGMRSADFYVNGYVWQTCAFGDIKSSNVTCAVVLNGANWNVGGGVYVNAKLTDAKGNVTWTAFRQYAVVAATANTTTNTTSQTTTQTTNTVGNFPGWVTASSNRDGGFRTNDRITYTANAGDGNGVNRIEMYVDGVLVKTCRAATCSFITAPVTNRHVTYYGATMYDNAGYSVWTGYKAINKI